MGNPQDPYSGLLQNFQARKQDYLRRLTTDDATFEKDPEGNGVALRRGFVKGKGPRPQCSVLDQDLAGDALGKYLAVWSDNSCLRAGAGEPWDGEDVRLAIARLTMFPDKDAFSQNLPFTTEPPSPESAAPRFRELLVLMRQLGMFGRGDFRRRIRTLMLSTQDADSFAPDYNPFPTFDSALTERVVESLDSGADPDSANLTGLSQLLTGLTSLRLEGHTETIPFVDALGMLMGLYHLLPGPLVVDVVQTALTKGRPGPYNSQEVIGGFEPPPDTREKPPDTREKPPDPREDPGSTFEKPPQGSDPAHPAQPPPRENTFLAPVWNTLAIFSWLGRLEMDGFTVRSGILGVSGWLSGGYNSLPQGKPGDGNRAVSLIQDVFSGAWIPAQDFVWPPYSREGLYWWRAVIQSHCIGQCFALNETADFHSTDLIRFLQLFPAPDPRIPDYVRTAAELALVWFKYWWDEPAAKNAKGDDQAEMTMWSENHQILFAQSQLLAGSMFRDREFPRTGNAGSGKPRTGQDHVNEAIPRVERWLDLRLRFGFSEWNAPGYYNEDLPPLFNLVDFSGAAAEGAPGDDERNALTRIRVKAAMVIDLIVFDFARFTCQGSFGVTAGRAYWEHKAYGWEQSIGNTIEVLFGTRGDYMGTEPAAVALCTSAYDVPEALLGIGLDRVLLDRSQPFSDRTRVSITLDEAGDRKIGFDSEEDVLFWWGLEGYYTDQTLEGTKRVVQAHPNLRMCGPFEPLYAISDGWFKQAILDLISATLDAIQAGGGIAIAEALPFPINIIFLAFDGKSIIDGITDFFKDIADFFKAIGKGGPFEGAAKGAAAGGLVAGVPGAVVGAVGGFVAGLFGGGDDNDQPQIPDSALQETVEKLLVKFSQGTVLSRANIVSWSNGDAMLSSVQNHLVGLTAFQKQPWEACLGNEACVWTTARFMSPDPASYGDAMERFLGDVGALHVKDAVIDVLATPLLQAFGKGDPFGHDGPNYWTGSLALPMIVQHENAAIIVYSIPSFQRTVSGASTHAWFPKNGFDETSKQDGFGGSWFFGRKDSADGRGSGYVALFTAREADWTNESGNNWNDKEIMTKGGSNIWVCMVGNRQQFGSFDTFRDEVAGAYLNISGVGSLNSLECSFDIPRASAPPGRSPRLEAFYDDRRGRFAGDDLELDNFPRFENRYTAQMVTRGPLGSGLRPQVQGFTTQNAVGFGSTGYRITHPATGLWLDHDTAAPARSHSSQSDQTTTNRRLQDGNLTAIRRPRAIPARQPAFQHPHLDLSSIRRRKP